MGAELWYYFVPYQCDIQKALNELREREFRAGRYNPVIRFPKFPVGGDYPGPGAKHRSIEEASRAAEADGTRSILDIIRIADEPDFHAVTPLSQEALRETFGTDQPTMDMIDRNMDFVEGIERGQGVYIVVYKDHMPSQIFFAGYSFD